MLIVNADDFGASVSATDPVIDAFERGLITSASAMVWMEDSERAAQLAGERKLPVGLHLNLTLPFSAVAPVEARRLQERLSSSLPGGRWRRPGESDIRAAIEQQLEAFRALYGEPIHIDGHHHVHVQRSVLACLPAGFPIRPPLRRSAALGGPPDRRERTVRRSFRTADGCVSFRQVHSSFGTDGRRAIEFARRHVLEVMVHPQLEDERVALYTREWVDALNESQLGTYADLPTR